MSEAMTRKPEPPRLPGELSEFDFDILGKSAVQLRIPVQHVSVTLDHLRKLHRVTERCIVILEAAKVKDDRHALFQVKSLLRGMGIALARAKRARF